MLPHIGFAVQDANPHISSFPCYLQPFLMNDVLAQFDTLIADEHGRASDKFEDLIIGFVTKGTVRAMFSGHFVSFVVPLHWRDVTVPLST